MVRQVIIRTVLLLSLTPIAMVTWNLAQVPYVDFVQFSRDRKTVVTVSGSRVQSFNLENDREFEFRGIVCQPTGRNDVLLAYARDNEWLTISLLDAATLRTKGRAHFPSSQSYTWSFGVTTTSEIWLVDENGLWLLDLRSGDSQELVKIFDGKRAAGCVHVGGSCSEWFQYMEYETGLSAIYSMTRPAKLLGKCFLPSSVCINSFEQFGDDIWFATPDGMYRMTSGVNGQDDIPIRDACWQQVDSMSDVVGVPDEWLDFHMYTPETNDSLMLYCHRQSGAVTVVSYRQTIRHLKSNISTESQLCAVADYGLVGCGNVTADWIFSLPKPRIEVRRLLDGTHLSTICPSVFPTSFDFSADGRELIVVSYRGEIQWFDATNGALLRTKNSRTWMVSRTWFAIIGFAIWTLAWFSIPTARRLEFAMVLGMWFLAIVVSCRFFFPGTKYGESSPPCHIIMEGAIASVIAVLCIFSPQRRFISQLNWAGCLTGIACLLFHKLDCFSWVLRGALIRTPLLFVTIPAILVVRLILWRLVRIGFPVPPSLPYDSGRRVRLLDAMNLLTAMSCVIAAITQTVTAKTLSELNFSPSYLIVFTVAVLAWSILETRFTLVRIGIATIILVQVLKSSGAFEQMWYFTSDIRDSTPGAMVVIFTIALLYLRKCGFRLEVHPRFTAVSRRLHQTLFARS